jgi:hypothetical protein
MVKPRSGLTLFDSSAGEATSSLLPAREATLVNTSELANPELRASSRLHEVSCSGAP